MILYSKEKFSFVFSWINKNKDILLQKVNTMSKVRVDTKTKKLIIYAMIIAIELLLYLTRLGYIQIGIVEITILPLPVAIAGALLGWKGGTIAGGIFGLTSFIECFGISPLGSELLNINIFYTFITAFLTRLIMGFLVGLIAEVMSKNTTAKKLTPVVVSLAAPVLNTLLFCSALVLFFWNTKYLQDTASELGAAGKSVFAFIVAFVGINIIVETAVCLVIGTVVCTILFEFKDKIGLKDIVK